MKRIVIVLLAVCFVVAGCSGPNIKKKDPSGAADPGLDNTDTTKSGSTTSTSGGGTTGGDNVQVLTGGGAGAATPVTGGENMGGGGGGVGNAAKDAARGVKTKVVGSDGSADDSAGN